MAGILDTVYVIAAVSVAVLGLLFVAFGTGERDRGLLVESVFAAALLVALGVTLLT